jgi:hypothetical protein
MHVCLQDLAQAAMFSYNEQRPQNISLPMWLLPVTCPSLMLRVQTHFPCFLH